jgi:hypothetical protein
MLVRVNRSHSWPQPDLIGQDRFDAWLDGHDRIWQYPSWFCGGLGRDPAIQYTAAAQETQIQLLAARKRAPTNSVYMARRAKDCEREAAEARALRMKDGTLYVFSRGAVAQVPALLDLATKPACRRLDWGVVCSTSWSGRTDAAPLGLFFHTVTRLSAPTTRSAVREAYIGDVRQRDASSPVAAVRSRSATSSPSCP